MEEDIKKLIEKNQELEEKIYKNTKYIKRYVIMSQVFGALKLLIIVVPIILGIIYLPPLIKDLTVKYQGFLKGSPLENILPRNIEELKELKGLNLDNIDLNKLPPDIKKLLQWGEHENTEVQK